MSIHEYDHMPALDAALASWENPGPDPEHHERMKNEVRRTMPLLARALDRETHTRRKRYRAIIAPYTCAACGHPSTDHDGGRECWHHTIGRDFGCQCRRATRPQEEP